MGFDLCFYHCDNMDKLIPYFRQCNQFYAEIHDTWFGQFEEAFYWRYLDNKPKDWKYYLLHKLHTVMLWVGRMTSNDRVLWFDRKYRAIREVLCKFPQIGYLGTSFETDYDYKIMELIIGKYTMTDIFIPLNIPLFIERVNSFACIRSELQLSPIWDSRFKTLLRIAIDCNDMTNVFCYWSD